MKFSEPNNFIINGYILKMTCYACPEQYEVFRNKEQVGYLRLRNGSFTASVPKCGGDIIYHANPSGDGIFENNERRFYLEEAIKKIQEQDEQTAFDMLNEKE